MDDGRAAGGLQVGRDHVRRVGGALKSDSAAIDLHLLERGAAAAGAPLPSAPQEVCAWDTAATEVHRLSLCLASGASSFALTVRVVFAAVRISSPSVRSEEKTRPGMTWPSRICRWERGDRCATPECRLELGDRCATHNVTAPSNPVGLARNATEPICSTGCSPHA